MQTTAHRVSSSRASWTRWAVVWVCAPLLSISLTMPVEAQPDPGHEVEEPEAETPEADAGDSAGDEANTDGDAEAPAAPDDRAAEPDFDTLVQQAAEAFSAKQYHTALALFEQAYALDPDPAILFNMGIIADKQGDFDAGLKYLNAFVMKPDIDVDAREEALRRIEQLEKLAAMRAQKDPPAEKDPPIPAPTPAPAKPEPAPSYMGPILVTSIGGALVVGGVVTGALASAEHENFEKATTLTERRAAASAGEDLALVTDILLIGGGAVAAGGVAWLLLVALNQDESDPVVVVPGVSPDAVSLGLSVQF